MIEPPPAAAISGATACAAKNWCRRFTAKRSSQYSGVTRSIVWRSSWAALLTSTRIGPEPRLRLGDRRAQRRDVPQVAGDERRRGMAAGRERSRRAPPRPRARCPRTPPGRAGRRGARRWRRRCRCRRPSRRRREPRGSGTWRTGSWAPSRAHAWASVSARVRLDTQHGSDHPARGRRRRGSRRRPAARSPATGSSATRRRASGCARLRPGAAAGNSTRAAAFPLVPYSNRIREGRFSFRDRAVVVPLNRPPERHAIHGHGWQAGWRPIDVGPRRHGSSTAMRPALGRGPITPRSGSRWRRPA